MSSSKSKAERLKAIKAGRGIQYILDEAYKIIGNPLLIHDMEYKLVAHSQGLPQDDPFCAEFMTNGALSLELIEFCMTESFIDSVSYSAEHDGITYLISDKLKYDRIFGQLYNKDRMPVADLIVLASESPFDDKYAELVNIICGTLSRELGRDAYYQEYGQKYQESILKKLIDGEIENKALYAAHVANIDSGLKSYIYVVVIRASRCETEYSELANFRNMLKQARPVYKYYAYKDCIVVLMSSGQPSLYIKRDFGKLCALFDLEDMYAGVSRAFENLYEISAYYNEAVNALRHGMKSGDGRIFLYNDKLNEERKK